MDQTISVTLPDDLAEHVREQVESGAYASASEVVSEAVRLWRRREQDRKERYEMIRAKIRASLDDPTPGKSIEEVFDRLERKHAEKVKSRGAV